MQRFVGPLLILLCTLIWGTAFLAQKTGSAHFGPFTLTAYRNILAGVSLLGAVAFRAGGRLGWWRCSRMELVGGGCSGVALFLAMIAQQLGIERTTPGISAFLTANYILLVPIFALLVGKGRAGLSVWGGVALALAGSYFLSVSPESGLTGIGSGELWTLLCAVLFAVQIMVVDHFAPGSDMLRFSMVQMFAAGLVAFPFVFLPSELARASWQGFVKGIPALVYLGIFSSGIAYTLQNLGQARTPPALAAILMSMESVFGALFGWLLLGDLLSSRQIVGCLLVLSAVILSQLLPARRT